MIRTVVGALMALGLACGCGGAHGTGADAESTPQDQSAGDGIPEADAGRDAAELADAPQDASLAEPSGVWQLEVDVNYACPLLRSYAAPESMLVRFLPRDQSMAVEVVSLGTLPGFLAEDVAGQTSLRIGTQKLSDTRYDSFDLEAETEGWRVSFYGATELVAGDVADRCAFHASGLAHPDTTAPEPR
jgi:hypothetical protein